jgi:AraC-like DNA-binding protein
MTGARQGPMLMIPLPYLFASAALWALWRHLRSDTAEEGTVFVPPVLVLIASQMAVIGTRFGYDLPGLYPLQQALAAVTPPAVWLVFRRPVIGPGLLWHLIPAVVLALLAMTLPVLVDGWLAAVSLTYAAMLSRLGFAGEDALPWAAFDQLAQLRRWLWAAALLLALTGLTDGLAALSAMTGAADLIGLIVALGMAFAAVAAVLLMRNIGTPSERLTQLDVTDHAPVFTKLEAAMSTGLFRDSDLTLQRIARKLGVPQRAVSRAVNTQARMNLSQYVNSHRVQAACRLLQETDRSVTEIMFDAGFITKSNFNRAFAQVTGQSPTDWRKSH